MAGHMIVGAVGVVGVVDAVDIEVTVHTVARTVVSRVIHWNRSMTRPAVVAAAAAAVAVAAAADTHTDSLAEFHNTANDPALPDLTNSGSNAADSLDELDSSDYTTVFPQPKHF